MVRITDRVVYVALMLGGCAPPTSEDSTSSSTDSSTTSTPSNGVVWEGIPFSNAGDTVTTLTWNGAPAIALTSPNDVAGEEWGNDVPGHGAWVLAPPFVGGVVHDVAVAGVVPPPGATWDPYYGHQGWGHFLFAADLNGDGHDDLAVDDAAVAGPFTGKVGAETGFAHWWTAQHGARCEVTGDDIGDLCQSDGVVAGPISGDIPRPDPIVGAALLAVLPSEPVDTVFFLRSTLRLLRNPTVGAWEGTTAETEWTANPTIGALAVAGTPASPLVVLTSPTFDTYEGRVWLLDPLGGDVATSSPTEIRGPRGTGKSAVFADFNADGIDDLAIGVIDHLSPGEVWVFLGPLPTGALGRGDASWILGNPDVADGFGWSLAAADLDQDGRDDLVVGAPWTPEPDVLDMFGLPSKKGAVYLYWGGGG